MLKKIFILFALFALLFSSCKKEVTPEDLTYKCDCGEFSLEGVSHSLTDSHWVTIATETDEFGFEVISGKDYYTTAKMVIEGELEPHHLNMRMTIPIINEGVTIGLDQSRFFEAHPDSNSVNILIEEINFNNLTTSIRYIVTAGGFELIENSQSENDIIDFQLDVAPSLDGFTPIGFPVSFNGNFTSQKEEI